MTDKKSIPLKGLASELAELPQATPQIVDTLVTQLEKEGFIQRKGSSIFIA
jgi:DNA-binding MarR family transcriptional regulator